MESSSLDKLAQAGIINFDADAYVKGTTPRFVGKPEGETYLPFDAPLTGFPMYGTSAYPRLSGAPASDAFVKREGEHGKEHKGIHIPLKQVLTAGLIGGIGLFAGVKIKNAIKSIPKTTPKVKAKAKAKAKANSKAAADAVTGKTFWQNVKDSVGYNFERAKDKVVSFFKPGEKINAQISEDIYEAAGKNATAAVKNTLKEFFSKKWVKGTGIAAGGLLALYAIAKLVSGGNHQAPPPPQNH